MTVEYYTERSNWYKEQTTINGKRISEISKNHPHRYILGPLTLSGREWNKRMKYQLLLLDEWGDLLTDCFEVHGVSL